MPTPVIVALDCSTTACKAVVFDLSGQTVCESRRYLTLTTPRPGWYEQEATQWGEAAADALTAVVDLLAPGHEPVALGITHQRETFVCVDERFRPVRPAILWLDNRAAAEVARLGTDDVHRITGKPPSTIPSFYKLAWLATHEPDTLRSTAQMLDVHAYLAWWLVGRAATSSASADSTGLLDLHRGAWSPPLLAACGLTEAQLPEVVAPGTVLGTLRPEVARRAGLSLDLPVFAGAGDGQCAGLGVGALAPRTAYLNLGTSFSLGVVTEGRPIHRGLRTLDSGLSGSSAVETLQPCGGMTLAWLSGTVFDDDLRDEAAAVPPGSEGLLFLPYLGGRETPGHEPDRRGAFLGLDVQHGRPQIRRAVIEGLAYDQRDCLTHLRNCLDLDIERVVMTGGYAQSDLVTGIFANVLGVRVEISTEREGTALGAAIIAAAGLGHPPYTSVEAAARGMSRPAEHVPVDVEKAKLYEQAYTLRSNILDKHRAATASLTALRRLSA